MLSAAKGILLDWDGCIAVNNRILPGAKQFIAQNADRVAIVSNNSTHLPGDFEELLAQHEVVFPAARIHLAGVEALRQIAASGVYRIMLLAVPRMQSFARSLGLHPVRENPDAVVLMRDACFTYRKLERAANALRQGARLVVANADLTHPGPNKSVVPETGSLLAALLACSGAAQAETCIIGKPGPLLFDRACQGLSIAPEQTIMIGDNPETDARGAERLGITPILVGGTSRLTLSDLLEPAAV